MEKLKENAILFDDGRMIPVQRNICFGCGACASVCSVNAIRITLDFQGFYMPEIDSSKCTNCGKCKKCCPALKKQNPKRPKCQIASAVRAYNSEKSASGGAFFALAKKFIEDGGYVAGVIWGSDWTPKHIVSNDIENIEKMRKSKYVQSNSTDV